MMKKNSVYIATSLDGFIADKKGGLNWLQTIANPKNNDFGFTKFMNEIDALIMGRKTFETVLGFDVNWPYTKPVFVLSNSLKEIPDSHQDKAFLVSGNLKEVLEGLHKINLNHIYIDGGTTIKSFLKEDLIDEMILTTIPILLGGGSTLFGDLEQHLEFELMSSTTHLQHIVQNHYKRKR